MVKIKTYHSTYSGLVPDLAPFITEQLLITQEKYSKSLRKVDQ